MEAPSTPQRQTLGYLRELFKERGIRPSNKLGQSFLIDLNVLDLVVRAAELNDRDVILEVGTGTGSLTARLAEAVRAVVSVEIDIDFYAMASETLAGRNNVVLMRADMLASKNTLNPEVLQTLFEVMEKTGSSAYKLVANLPYAVATPVIADLLLIDRPPARMVAMVQAEIAERMSAKPGVKDYGALSILVQSLAEVHIVRNRLSPAVFWPRPQVESSIVLIRPDPERRVQVGDPTRFRHFLRDLYSHRRKNLRGALSGWPSGRRDKAVIDRMLGELGLDGSCRAEELDIAQHLRLCEAFSKIEA